MERIKIVFQDGMSLEGFIESSRYSWHVIEIVKDTGERIFVPFTSIRYYEIIVRKICRN
jgi:hypothetical protein